jgi:hypothetical protein
MGRLPRMWAAEVLRERPGDEGLVGAKRLQRVGLGGRVARGGS